MSPWNGTAVLSTSTNGRRARWPRSGRPHLQVPVVERCHDIAADCYERRLTQQLERVHDAAQSLERVFGSLALARVPDARVVAGAVAERVLDQAGVMRGVDDELANARPRQPAICHSISIRPPARGAVWGSGPISGRIRSPRRPRRSNAFILQAPPLKGNGAGFFLEFIGEARRSSKAG